jgi:hypothetical protein
MQRMKDNIMNDASKTYAERPARLEAEYQNGAGWHIYAYLVQKTPCVEFTMKQGFQPMVNSTERFTMAIDMWRQFPPESLDRLEQKLFMEMVEAWNEKYAYDVVDDETASKIPTPEELKTLSRIEADRLTIANAKLTGMNESNNIILERQYKELHELRTELWDMHNKNL